MIASSMSWLLVDSQEEEEGEKTRPEGQGQKVLVLMDWFNWFKLLIQL